MNEENKTIHFRKAENGKFVVICETATADEPTSMLWSKVTCKLCLRRKNKELHGTYKQ